MTREDVCELLRRHKDALNRHDLPALMTVYAQDATVTSPMFNTVRGRAAIEGTFKALFKLWPDYQILLKDSLFIHEGNRAAEFGSVMTRHHAELFGLPPTGEQIEYDCVRLYTFHAGQIVDERRIYDLAGILERLGKSQLEHQLKMAADIQRLLLPRTHHAGAYFEAVGRSIPCRTIGGDFFEYADLPSGDFAIALGDVSGKGPAAALVAAMLQGILSVEAEGDCSPSITLSRMNQALRRRGMEPHFVTLMYGVLSPDGRLRYSNAAQNPPILLTDTDVHRLTAGGTMLGVFEDPGFPEETVSLQCGDTLVVFSDGVTEALNGLGEEFTDARLLESVTRHRKETPQIILDALLDHVRTFCGDAAPNDDITSVVMRFR